MRNNQKNAYFIGVLEHVYDMKYLSLADLISYDILRTWETREPGGLPSFSEGC